MANISWNYDDWNIFGPIPTPTPKKRGVIELNDEVMRESNKSLRAHLVSWYSFQNSGIHFKFYDLTCLADLEL
jgi:hypothetical protein